MADVDPEEARLIAAMEKKANAEFEKKRKEALAKAQRSGKGQNFHLAEEPANAAGKRPVAQPRHHDLPSEHHAEPAPAPAPRAAAPPAADDAIKPGQELSKYMEASAQRDREFRERQEAAEREKQAALSGFGSSLSKYEEQARQRDLDAKKHREEEEKRRADDVAAQATKQDAYRQRQANEEAEFRRRHEEAEKSKQDTLNQMKAADDARRQAALQRDADSKRVAAPAPVVRANVCTACNKEFPEKALVNVKGKTYCYGCSIAAQADTCFGCNKPILSGAMLKANNRKYHPECLRCSLCKTQLTDGFRMRGKDIRCIGCSSKP